MRSIISNVTAVLSDQALTAANRDQMIELCRRIHRETDPKKLALWITDLKALIHRKVDELKKQQAGV